MLVWWWVLFAAVEIWDWRERMRNRRAMRLVHMTARLKRLLRGHR